MFVIVGTDGRPAIFAKSYDPPVAAFSTMEKAQAYIDFYVRHLGAEKVKDAIKIEPLDNYREWCQSNGIRTRFTDPRPIVDEGNVEPL